MYDIFYMDCVMTFLEKSAWVMSCALLIAGILYTYVLIVAWTALGEAPPPNIGFVVILTVPLTALAIFGHAVAALGNPTEANAPEDERDRTVAWRAGNLSGALLGAITIAIIGFLAMFGSANLAFHMLVLGLVFAQIAEYALTILFYRWGV